jgi:hypothetical protein
MKALISNSPVFTGILTLVLIILFVWFIYYIIPVLKNATEKFSNLKGKLKHLKSIGLFGLITGVLFQLISIYSIISAIEEAGDINPGLVISSLKISMIPMIYGIAIYLLSLILWIISDMLLKKKTKS